MEISWVGVYFDGLGRCVQFAFVFSASCDLLVLILVRNIFRSRLFISNPYFPVWTSGEHQVFLMGVGYGRERVTGCAKILQESSQFGLAPWSLIYNRSFTLNAESGIQGRTNDHIKCCIISWRSLRSIRVSGHVADDTCTSFLFCSSWKLLCSSRHVQHVRLRIHWPLMLRLNQSAWTANLK